MRHSFILVLALVTTVAAQASFMGHPTSGTSFQRGSQTTVQLVRPVSPDHSHKHLLFTTPQQNSIQGSREVGLTLSFQSCPFSPCPPANQQLGTIMFIGDFNPQLHEHPGKPYQNFTVKIPHYEFMESGRAEIIATRFHLIGAGPGPVLETNFVEVDLVD